MAKPAKNNQAQSQIMMMALIFAGVAVAFAALLIYPQYRSMHRQDTEIAKLKANIEEQKLLHPLYVELYKKAQFEEPEGLPFPQGGAINKKEFASLDNLFQDLAAKSNLEFDSVLPQVNTLADNSGRLRVDLAVYGEFENLRSFMLNLAEMPFVQHLEQIRVQRAEPSDTMALRLWLALK